MSKDYARVERLYHVMVELLNAPKTIDVMRKMPCQVKDGQVLDFNGRTFGDTDKPEGYIFGGEKEFNRVCDAQAITMALKRDYTNALMKWIDGEDDAELHEETQDVPKKSKGKKSKAETKAGTSADVEGNEPEAFELLDEVSELLEDGKVKKAKKLLATHEDHADFKKAKKLIKKAGK